MVSCPSALGGGISYLTSLQTSMRFLGEIFQDFLIYLPVSSVNESLKFSKKRVICCLQECPTPSTAWFCFPYLQWTVDTDSCVAT